MKRPKCRPAESSGVPDVYVAGQIVSAGVYREIETGREVALKHEGILPAACDGRVATYMLRPATWGELSGSNYERAA